MTALYAAGGVLIAAQLVGIYALISRKADLVFSILMVVLVLAAVGLAGYGARDLGHL